MKSRVFAFLLCVILLSAASALAAEPVKALYVGSNTIEVPSKIKQITELLRNYEVNAVVADKKDDNGFEFSGARFRKMIQPFRAANAFIICRIVVFKDNIYSRMHPDLYIKSRENGGIWKNYSGAQSLDPAEPRVLQYILEVSLRAAADGCGELNYDYIRFPSDGNLKDMVYPSGEQTGRHKRETMRKFLHDLAAGIRAQYPNIPLSADVFGYAAFGREPGIGQYIEDFAAEGFGIYAMAYPSHYMCNEFGAADPNKIPYTVYAETLAHQLRYLKKHGYTKVNIRPWLQGFNYNGGRNIYGCKAVLDKKTKKIVGQRGKVGERTDYETDTARFREQIRALNDVRAREEFKDMNIPESWIVWHSSAKYNPALFKPKHN